jgi:response regulator RpfG family c-di-GMP phosphodiesterase
MVRATHERYDGTGYPDQRAGPTIPLISQIVSICDSFGAITHDRPYRPARRQVTRPAMPQATAPRARDHRGPAPVAQISGAGIVSMAA